MNSYATKTHFQIPLVTFDDLLELIDSGEECQVRCEIGQDEAFTLLTRNTVNRRRIRPSVVKKYLFKMEKGTYLDDHPLPIIFDSEGLLLDGQHRLTARFDLSIAYKLSYVMRFELGQDKTTLEPHIDDGAARVVAERVTFDEDRQQNEKIAFVLKGLQYFCPAKYGIAGRKRYDWYLVKLFESRTDEIKDIARQLPGNRNLLAHKQPIVAAFAVAYLESNRRDAVTFYGDLKNDESCLQQAQKLKSWMLDSRKWMKTNRSSKQDLFERTLYVFWSYWKRKNVNSMRSLKFWPEEDRGVDHD